MVALSYGGQSPWKTHHKRSWKVLEKPPEMFCSIPVMVGMFQRVRTSRCRTRSRRWSTIPGRRRSSWRCRSTLIPSAGPCGGWRMVNSSTTLESLPSTYHVGRCVVKIKSNQSTFVKRLKSRANRRRVKRKARPSGYRMLWQKVPSLKHVWKRSQSWLIDNLYGSVFHTWRRAETWMILSTSWQTFEV